MENSITLTIDIEPEDDQFVATCRELDVSSFGRTVEDAVEHLEQAIALYLNVIEEDGEREQIFRERGIAVTPRLTADYRVNGPPGSYTAVRRVPLPA